MIETTGPHVKVRRRFRASALVASVWLASSPAVASAPPGDPATEEAAIQAFSEGRYDDAISLFEELYEDTGDPNYLYNVGRLHEDDGQLEKAYAYYERLVASRGVDLDLRVQTAERMKMIQTIIETTRRADAERAQDSAGAQEAPSDSDDAATASEPPGGAASTGPVDRVKPTKIASAGYGLLAVGGAALIAGGSVAILARSDARALSEQPDDPEAVRDRGRTKAWIADGLFIAGGVVAATGLALVIVDVVKRRKSSQVARRNWHLDGGAGMVGIGISGRI